MRIPALILSIALGAATVAAQPSDFVFLTTTDFASGSSAVLDESPKAASTNVTTLHSDATSRYFGGLVYVVNRLGGDNIQVLDPSAGFSTSIQFSVDNGSDPHDIAVLSPTVAYVTRYNTNDIWKVNPSTGAHTGTISLAALADADGLAEIDQLLLVGDRLFVSVQRLDRNNFYTPVGTSYLVVIDTATDTIVDVDGVAPGTQSILLGGANPFSEIQIDGFGRRLYVSSVGFFGVLDGGVEAVDPDSYTSSGYILTEAAAGGDVLDVEIVAPDRGFAVISTPSFVTELIAFDPSTGTKTATLYAPGDYVIQDIDVSPSSGHLYLTDRTPTDPGVRCYDTGTGVEITTGPIDTGLPPFDITFSEPVQTGIGDTPPAAAMGPNYPNPFNPATVIPFTLSHAAEVTLSIFDASGRHVVTLIDGVVGSGDNRAEWTGYDATGAPVASGVYFARLEAAGRSTTRKLTLLK